MQYDIIIIAKQKKPNIKENVSEVVLQLLCCYDSRVGSACSYFTFVSNSTTLVRNEAKPLSELTN